MDNSKSLSRYPSNGSEAHLQSYTIAIGVSVFDSEPKPISHPNADFIPVIDLKFDAIFESNFQSESITDSIYEPVGFADSYTNMDFQSIAVEFTDPDPDSNCVPDANS